MFFEFYHTSCPESTYRNHLDERERAAEQQEDNTENTEDNKP